MPSELVINGVKYPALNQAAKTLNMRAPVISYRCKSPLWENYFFIKKIIEVDGVKYETIAEVSNATGVKRSGCYFQFGSHIYPNWKCSFIPKSATCLMISLDDGKSWLTVKQLSVMLKICTNTVYTRLKKPKWKHWKTR